MAVGTDRGTIGRFQTVVSRALSLGGVGRRDPMAVACSHGPDSLALADAILALRDRGAAGEVTLIYVDHGLRREATAEGAAVTAYATGRGAGARTVSVRLARASEDAARAARYAALDSAADEVGARWIAFGHTASDQAETVILRLIRGAGVTGLAGIPAVRGRYVRPLLSLTRAEVEAYLTARRLTPSHDASNDTPAFTRNRVRSTILPALRAENPAIDAALARAAAALREAAESLDWAAAQALRTVGRNSNSDAVRLDARALSLLPPGLAKRALSLAAAPLGASLEARHLAALLALAAAPTAGTRVIRLPGAQAREYGDLLLEPAAAPGIQRQRHVRVDVTGPDGPYRVRAWQPGDRMRPTSLKGRSRKLQDLFTDKKIPAAARSNAVVVVREADGAIVWTEYLGPAVGIPVEVTLTEIAPRANT